MPIAHLICGSTGAGKTTYALELARREGALRFTVDEWMAQFFWPDDPDPLTYEWALERVERCERHALSLAAQVLALDGGGTDAGDPVKSAPDVILDFGFFTRGQRRGMAAGLSAQGWTVRLHYLHLPADERWRRVSLRNGERGETYALQVTRGMFDFCEDLFEPPDAAELEGAVLPGAVVVKGGSKGNRKIIW